MTSSTLPPIEAGDEWITAKEAAAILRCSDRTLKRNVRTGKWDLPHVPLLAGRYLFRLAANENRPVSATLN